MCDFKLITISKLSSEIQQDTCKSLNRPETVAHLRPFEDLKNAVGTKKVLDARDTDTIYWKYSRDEFFRISDYISFAAAMILSADKRFYLVLHDYESPWVDNGEFLRVLERVEARRERERRRDIYDVKIKRPGDADSDEEDEKDLAVAEKFVPVIKRTNFEVINFATKKEMYGINRLTMDNFQEWKMIQDIKRATASLLCFANILGMKGEIISCPHKDIYFLETNTKSETTDLANLFAPPSGRDMAKYKPRTKLKHKLNPALEFVVQNKTTKNGLEGKHQEEGKCGTSGNQSERTSRRNSIDLYEEAATILGLTCSQTDDCKCIECQCHYFDFEEEIDFPATGECVMDHPSSCSIQ